MSVVQQGNFVDELIEQMRENEQKTLVLLQQAESMSQAVNWSDMRRRILASNEEKEAITNLISSLVDVYCGIMSNCAMFGTGCSMSAEFLSAATVTQLDPTSLDWILNSANGPSKTMLDEQELQRLLESFAEMAEEASTGLKRSVLLAIGL